MLIFDLLEIGQKCKNFRLSQGATLADVATDTGYSVPNVCAFENGRNDNARIMLWYFNRGLTFQHLKGALNRGKNI